MGTRPSLFGRKHRSFWQLPFSRSRSTKICHSALKRSLRCETLERRLCLDGVSTIEGSVWYDLDADGVRDTFLQGDLPDVLFCVDVSGSTTETTFGKIGEAFKVQVTQQEDPEHPGEAQWYYQSFGQEAYNDPVVIAGLSEGIATPDGDDFPATVQVKLDRLEHGPAVGFWYRVRELYGDSPAHGTETVEFIVMESGRHILDDGSDAGQIVEVGTLDIGPAKALNYGVPFDDAPVLVAQIMSDNYDWDNPLMPDFCAADEYGFQLDLKDYEGIHPAGKETVGYIAIERGRGGVHDFEDEPVSTYPGEAVCSLVANYATEVPTSGWKAEPFCPISYFRPPHFAETPVLVASPAVGRGSIRFEHWDTYDNINFEHDGVLMKRQGCGSGQTTVNYLAIAPGSIYARPYDPEDDPFEQLVIDADVALVGMLAEQLQSLGTASSARVGIVYFQGSSEGGADFLDVNPEVEGTQVYTTAVTGADNNGEKDLTQQAEGLRNVLHAGTPYSAALQRAYQFFDTYLGYDSNVPWPNANIVFVSDGEPNDTIETIEDAAQPLHERGVNIVTLRVGDQGIASPTVLDGLKAVAGENTGNPDPVVITSEYSALTSMHYEPGVPDWAVPYGWASYLPCYTLTKRTDEYGHYVVDAIVPDHYWVGPVWHMSPSDEGPWVQTYPLLWSSIIGHEKWLPVSHRFDCGLDENGEPDGIADHHTGADFGLIRKGPGLPTPQPNSPPSLVTNALAIGQGGSRILSRYANLLANDPDLENSYEGTPDDDGSLEFTISLAQNGHFEVWDDSLSVPGFADVTCPFTITMAEVANEHLKFVHDGTENAPSYWVEVSDGLLTDGPYEAQIAFYKGAPAPYVGRCDVVNYPPVAYSGGGNTWVYDLQLHLPVKGRMAFDPDGLGSTVQIVIESQTTGYEECLTWASAGSMVYFTFTPPTEGWGYDSSVLPPEDPTRATYTFHAVDEHGAVSETATLEFDGAESGSSYPYGDGYIDVHDDFYSIPEDPLTPLTLDPGNFTGAGDPNPLTNDQPYDWYDNPIAWATILQPPYDVEDITITVVQEPSHGQLTPSDDFDYVYRGDEDIVYTPDPDYNGYDTLLYDVSAPGPTWGYYGGTGCINIDVGITTPVPDMPTPADDAYSLLEDTILRVAWPSLGVLANDGIPGLISDDLGLHHLDPDGDLVSGRLYTLPQHGTLSAFASDGTFIYEPLPDFYGVDSFQYIPVDVDVAECVMQSGIVSEPYLATVTLTVLAVNDRPVVDLNGSGSGNDAGALFVAGAGAVPVEDSDAAITDVDDACLTQMTVTIDNLLDGAYESLSATAGYGISISYNAGVLTLSGSATLSEYGAVLRTVTYNNTSATPHTTPRQIEFRAYDGDDYSLIATTTLAIEAISDPPAMDLNGPAAGVDFTTAFTEGDAPVLLVDDEATLVEPDGEALSSIFVSLAGGVRDPDEEGLAVDTGETNIIAYLSSDGTSVMLSGEDTAANYLQVLKTLVYYNDSQAPDATDREFLFTAYDLGGNSSTATSTVAITAVNDLPVIDLGDFTAEFVEDGGPVYLLDDDAVLDEVDGENIGSAVVTLVGGPLDVGQESLSVDVGETNIAASLSSDGTVLTLTGADTAANYLQVLKTIAYDNASQNPDETTRQFTFRVYDAVGSYSDDSTSVSVTAVDDAIVVTTAIDENNTNVDTSLREALLIAAESPGPDTITFAPALTGSTIELTLGTLIVDSEVAIEGLGDEVLTIHGGSFYVNPNTDASFSGMRLVGCRISATGHYSIPEFSNITISGLTISDCTSSALYLTKANAIIDDTVFENNDSYYGGAIWANAGVDNDSQIVIRNSTFLQNAAGYQGGAIELWWTTTLIQNSVFIGNTSVSDGGAINSYVTDLDIEGCEFTQNRSNSYGGAIYTYNWNSYTSPLDVVDSTFNGNVGSYGGAIYNWSNSSVVDYTHIVNSAFAGNRATQDGGALYVKTIDQASLTNVTLAGNKAGRYGGGVYRYSGSLTGKNTIVSLNEAGTTSYRNAYPSNPFAGGSTNNLLNADPLFVENPYDGGDGWGDNPSTPGVDESANDDYGDLRLTADSPAIDAGNDTAAEGILHDLNGDDRLVGAHVDIGAYEYQHIYIVDSPLDVVAADGVITLREALQAANTNTAVNEAHAGSAVETDLIRFAPSLAGGTIYLGGTQLEILDDVIIKDTGAGSLTVDAGGASRVFSVAAGVEATFSGLTITGGAVTGGLGAGSGAGIYAGSGAKVTVDSVTFSGNSAAYSGGGIHGATSSVVTVTDCTFSDNVVTTYYGGGIAVEPGSVLSVESSQFTGNTAGATGSNGYGGAITGLTGTTVSVNGSTFTGGNTASNAGGAIAVAAGGSEVTITDSVFTGNSATMRAGAILVYGNATSVTGCTLTGNSSASGGAIHAYGPADLIVTNSTIAGNKATLGSGGGICGIEAAEISVVNSIVVDNVASSNGGGIFGSATNVITVLNTTIAANRASSAGGGLAVSNNTATAQNCIVALNWAPSNANIAGTLDVDSCNNLIDTNPTFVRDPGPGTDQTWGTADDDYGDLRLLAGSPAINAGDNVAADGIDYDLQGDPRFIYTTVDIGAYEYTIVGDANRNGTVGQLDAMIVAESYYWGAPGVATWADGDFDRNGYVDDNDLYLLALNWKDSVVDPPVSAELPDAAVDQVFTDAGYNDSNPENDVTPEDEDWYLFVDELLMELGIW